MNGEYVFVAWDYIAVTAPYIELKSSVSQTTLTHEKMMSSEKL